MKRSCILAWVMAAWPLGNAAVPADTPLVLDVWPGMALGDHGQIGPERVRAVDEAPTADAQDEITNVTRPTISVFRPEADRNARVALIICPGGGYWNLAWDKEGEGVGRVGQCVGNYGGGAEVPGFADPGEPEPLPARAAAGRAAGRQHRENHPGVGFDRICIGMGVWPAVIGGHDRHFLPSTLV